MQYLSPVTATDRSKVCLCNKLAIFLISLVFCSIPPIRAGAPVMYLMVQSCLHVVVNFLWPSEPDQNMPQLSHFYGPDRMLQFHENMEIPWIRANSVAWLKIPHSVVNCGPRLSVSVLFVKQCRAVVVFAFLCFRFVRNS